MKTLFPIFLTFFFFCNCSSNTEDQSNQSSEISIPQKKVKNQQKSAYSDLNVEQFKTKMQTQDVVILDVRTPKETAEGIIEGAIEIDIKSDSFAQKIAALDKDKTYLIYCRSGKRSVAACNQMAGQEFKSLYNLLGGYNAWKKAEE